MRKHTILVLAWLALGMMTETIKAQAQEALGDAARRIRANKNNEQANTTSVTAPVGQASAGQASAAVAPQHSRAEDMNAAMNLISETDLEKYAAGVKTLLEQERFRVLDDIANADRTNRARFAGGGWKLAALYEAMVPANGSGSGAPVDWSALLERLKRWVAQQPSSITARVALADAALTYAWQTRGNGYIESATPDGKRLFMERVKQAESTLNQASDLLAKCPEWYSVMLQVGRAAGWEKEDLTVLFQRAVAYDPQYYAFYQQQAISLLPRWRGQEGEVEKFAEESANKIGGKPGDILYWQITQAIVSQSDPAKFPQKLSWARALLGYQAMSEQYGASLLRLNQNALMAARFGDFMVADETLKQIGNRWDKDTWGTQGYFDKIKAWAAENAGPFRKLMEAYKSVNANIGTPEGQKYDSVIAKEFTARYARSIHECVAGSAAPTLLVMQVAKSGAVQQVMIVPEGTNEACLRPKLEKAAFSPPPQPEYWVRVSLASQP